ncbi:hypothetical protein M378DRAFT_173850, partial [Amanita muscaria Koide BX008]
LIRGSNIGNNSATGGAKAKCSNCGATMGKDIISHVLVPVVGSEHLVTSL